MLLSDKNLTEDVRYTVNSKRHPLAVREADHDASLVTVVENQEPLTILVDKIRLPNGGLLSCAVKGRIITLDTRDSRLRASPTMRPISSRNSAR
jgi:hypothetical protein